MCDDYRSVVNQVNLELDTIVLPANPVVYVGNVTKYTRSSPNMDPRIHLCPAQVKLYSLMSRYLLLQ